MNCSLCVYSVFTNLLRVLESRWISEGVIDDPYGEFLIDENKALQKVHLWPCEDYSMV